MNSDQTKGDEPDVETLQLVYDGLVRERDRLRDARRAVTAQLGPLPAAGAVALGLFAGLPDNIQNRGLVGFALALFGAALLVSAWGIRHDPYRRQGGQLGMPTREDGLRDDDVLPREDWLLQRIKDERLIYYGAPAGGAQEPETLSLQASFDRERSALLAVQLLVAAEVVVLALARLLP